MFQKFTGKAVGKNVAIAFVMAGLTLMVIFTSLQPALAANAQSYEATIRVSTTPLKYADLFRQLTEVFEAKHPEIKIKLETPAGNQADAIQLALRQGVVKDLPDVSFQGLNYIKPLADHGYVIPLDSFIAGDSGWSGDIYSSSVTSVSMVGKKTMGLGAAFTVPIIYYNADLVAEAQNGDPNLPGNWEAILGLAKKIQAAHPDVLGAYTRYNAFIGQGHIMSMGGRIGNEDGSIATLTEPQALEAIRLIAEFGKAGQGALNLSTSQARQQFVSGKLGILLDSASALKNYSKKSNGIFTLGTAHFPFTEKSTMPVFGLVVLMHTDNPERQKAAWEFMKFVTGPQGQTIIGRQTGYIPANQVAVRRSDLLGDYYKTLPIFNAALETLPIAVPYYVFQGDGSSARVNRLFEDVLRLAVTGQLSPGETAERLNNKITAIIPR